MGVLKLVSDSVITYNSFLLIDYLFLNVMRVTKELWILEVALV